MSDLTTVRKLIRSEAQRAEAYQILDAMLGDAAEINKLVVEKQGELDRLTAAVADARAGGEKALAERDAIIAAAQAKADGIIAAANEQDARANADRQAAEHELANARQKAAALVEQGRADAATAAQDADGRLGELRAEIEAAETTLASIASETAAAEAKRDTAEARLAEIRKQIG
jgi:hypothetical protein